MEFSGQVREWQCRVHCSQKKYCTYDQLILEKRGLRLFYFGLTGDSKLCRRYQYFKVDICCTASHRLCGLTLQVGGKDLDSFSKVLNSCSGLANGSRLQMTKKTALSSPRGNLKLQLLLIKLQSCPVWIPCESEQCPQGQATA